MDITSHARVPLAELRELRIFDITNWSRFEGREWRAEMPARSEYAGERGVDFPLPEFKPDTLTSLAKKIQESLGKPSLEIKENAKRQATKQKEKGGKKLPSTAPILSNPRFRSSTGKLDPPERGQGKKRLRNGQAKRDGSEHKTAREKADTGGTVSKPNNNVESKFRDDILALGGTEEDYRLIQNAGSDSEIEGITNRDTNSNPEELKTDLLSLVNESNARKSTNPRKVKNQGKSENDGNNTRHSPHTQKAVLQGSRTNGVKPAHVDANVGSTHRLVSTGRLVATHVRHTDKLSYLEVPASVSVAYRLFARIALDIQTRSHFDRNT